MTDLDDLPSGAWELPEELVLLRETLRRFMREEVRPVEERQPHDTFALPPGETSRAVTHRTVEEIWYFLEGRGEMWRRQGDREEVVAVEPGVCLTIPLGTHFQFRALGDRPLSALGVTMPPWPGPDEAVPVEGPWAATL